MEQTILWAMITLLSSFLVGYILWRLGIPGGMMLGGIIGAAAYNLLTDCAYMPSAARFFSQSIAGGFLGASLSQKDLKNFRRLIFPLIVVILGIFLSDIAIGFLITRISPLDNTTALMAGIAGGINDIPLIADELGADAGKVAVLQFVRLLAGIGLFPVMIRAFDSPRQQIKHTPCIRRIKKGKREPVSYSASQTVITILIALLGGSIGRLIKIPAGILVFSMLTTAILRLTTGIGSTPPRIKQTAQLLAGAYIGCMLDRKDILELKYLVLPAVVLVVVFAVNCLASSFIICLGSNFSLKEAMLATPPAGAGEIALISSDLDISQDFAADIMVLHIFRVIAAVTILPQLVQYVAKLI